MILLIIFMNNAEIPTGIACTLPNGMADLVNEAHHNGSTLPQDITLCDVLHLLMNEIA